MAKLNLDDILAEEKDDVQTFKKAEKKAEIIKEAEKNKKEVGRPTKSEDEKAKKRTLYYTDSEWEQIEKVSELYGVKPVKWLKMIIAKELRREGYELK